MVFGIIIIPLWGHEWGPTVWTAVTNTVEQPSQEERAIKLHEAEKDREKRTESYSLQMF